MSEKKILLRLDADTYDKVLKQSKEENRSVNGQLVNIIQKSFKGISDDLINLSKGGVK